MSESSSASSQFLDERKVLACRLRKKTTGRAAQIPTAGEVELENLSSEVIEIETLTSPLQYLDLVVTNSGGERVSDSFYGDLFSPLEKPFVSRLLPGQKYVGPVGLLGNVPEAELLPGRYLVQGVYQYEGFHALSDPLWVEWSAAQETNGIGSTPPFAEAQSV